MLARIFAGRPLGRFVEKRSCALCRAFCALLRVLTKCLSSSPCRFFDFFLRFGIFADVYRKAAWNFTEGAGKLEGIMRKLPMKFRSQQLPKPNCSQIWPYPVHARNVLLSQRNSPQEVRQWRQPQSSASLVQSAWTPREVKLTKKNKPYITCDPCGLQVFVRGPAGIAEFKRLVERGERDGLSARIEELERRCRPTCPKCGNKFWVEKGFIKTSGFDGSFKGFLCPVKSCGALVPW